jgi:hypothetical protein
MTMLLRLAPLGIILLFESSEQVSPSSIAAPHALNAHRCIVTLQKHIYTHTLTNNDSAQPYQGKESTKKNKTSSTKQHSNSTSYLELSLHEVGSQGGLQGACGLFAGAEFERT